MISQASKPSFHTRNDLMSMSSNSRKESKKTNLTNKTKHSSQSRNKKVIKIIDPFKISGLESTKLHDQHLRLQELEIGVLREIVGKLAVKNQGLSSQNKELKHILRTPYLASLYQ